MLSIHAASRIKPQPVLGLRANLSQFGWLVLVNGFVGGMVGLERSILPRLAESEFHLESKTALLSFIVVFGISKAVSNYVSGAYANVIGRKKLLVIGWLFALPVPFILMYANAWSWVVFANLLLGINQGLSWSSTVLMKIDLVGEKDRGLAMGFNEFAGYVSVALVAYLSSVVADRLGLRPFPFMIGVVLSLAGLFISVFLIRDTHAHVQAEVQTSRLPQIKHIFWMSTFRHPVLSSVTQAGLVNNLNDGMVWGLLPVLLYSKHFSLVEIGQIVAVYPAVWGLAQLFTGKLADMFNKVYLIVLGMALQGIALLLMIGADTFAQFFFLAALLGLGTAMVYPVFMGLIAETTHPLDRPKSIGVFRLWRDLGYAIGAVLTGMLADLWGLESSFVFVGLLTLVAGLLMVRAKSEKRKAESRRLNG